MISWIQRNFQQHFKWLFLAMLVVIIISFVFVTNTSQGLGSGNDRKLAPKPFFGLDLSQTEDQRRLFNDAQLSIYLRFNPQREVPEAQLQQYALNRHAALHLADEARLPDPTPEQLRAHLISLKVFEGTNGAFDPKKYNDFLDSLKTNPRTSEADVSRVLNDDARAQAYEKLLAGPGYVLPADVSDILAQRDTTWTLAVAKINGSAFAPTIDEADATVQKWFDTNVRRYEIPARVAVAALEIPGGLYTASVTLTEAEIRAAYDANPSKYPAPPAPPTPTDIKLDPITGKDPKADLAFLTARPLVEAELRQTRANKVALDAAADYAVRLLERNVSSAGLADFVAKHPGLVLAELGPVGPDSIPAALGGNTASAQILPEVERLSADRLYSNPVPTPTGAALLVWRETIPARTPTFADVREKVLGDYRSAEKRRLFNEAGRALQPAVTAALATGKPFAEAVTAAAVGLKVEVTTPKPFSLSGNFPEDLDYTAMQALQTLAKGKVSAFLPSGEDAGVVVYAIDQQVPATDPNAPAFKEMKTRLADNIGQSNAQSVISALVEAELEKSAPVVD